MTAQITDDKSSRTVTISDYAALKGVTTDQVESLVRENRLPTLEQNGQKLVEIETRDDSKDESSTPASREQLLEKLLQAEETSARKNERAKRKWQLLSAMSLAIFFPAMATVIWLYSNVTSLDNDLNAVRMEKQALTEQLGSANAVLRNLSSQLETLQEQNTRLNSENAEPTAQSTESTSSSEPTQNQVSPGTVSSVNTSSNSVSSAAPNANRLNAIRQGNHPPDTTKAELIEALGKPDRIYQAREYEQLVYFDRSPGRFWFSGNGFVEASR